MIQLEFDSSKAYGDIIFERNITYEDYLRVPIIAWCIKHIGPLDWPRSPDQVLAGTGWQIYADWSRWMSAKYHDRPPKTVLILDNDVDPKLITEFWMKFGI